MSEKPVNEYLKAKIMTATPQQLQTMLFDGAIRFCEQAKGTIAAGDISATHDRLLRAQRIVLELSSNMKVEMNPELHGRLSSLYNYVYRLLIDANLNKDVAKVTEALGLLHYQRETWQLALEKVATERADALTALNDDADDEPLAAADADTPQAALEAPPGGRLSVEG